MSDALFDTAQRSSVTAFKPGFRMLVGDTTFRDREEARRWRQLTYICLDANQGNRAPESIGFPTTPCPGGIMAVCKRLCLFQPLALFLLNHDHKRIN